MPKHLQCTLAAIVTCILGSLIVGLVTITEWLAPTTPALFLLGAALVPAILVGLLVVSPPEKQPWTRSLLLTGTIPGVILGIITVAIGLFWTQPEVRANIASSIPTDFQDAQPLLKALNDPFEQVATAACISLANTDFKNHYRNVIVTLTSRPTVALSCLKNTKSTNANILSDLAQTWHQNLILDPLDASDACELSNSLAKIQNNQDVHTSQILHCALNANTPHAQQCCTQTLTQSYQSAPALAKTLAKAHELLANLALGPDLINASFYDTPHVGTMSLKTKEFQRIALRTNCATLEIDARAPINSFIKLAKSLNCDDNGQEFPDQPDAWARVCENLTRQLTAQTEQSPDLALCAALDNEKQFVAVIKAEQKAMLEQANEDLSGLTEMIAIGSERIAVQGPNEYLNEITGESFDTEGYDAEDIAMFRNLAKSTEMEPDDESQIELTAESLKMLDKFPEYIEVLKSSGMPKEQLEQLQKMGESLKSIPRTPSPATD